MQKKNEGQIEQGRRQCGDEKAIQGVQHPDQDRRHRNENQEGGQNPNQVGSDLQLARIAGKSGRQQIDPVVGQCEKRHRQQSQ